MQFQLNIIHLNTILLIINKSQKTKLYHLLKSGRCAFQPKWHPIIVTVCCPIKVLNTIFYRLTNLSVQSGEFHCTSYICNNIYTICGVREQQKMIFSLTCLKWTPTLQLSFPLQVDFLVQWKKVYCGVTAIYITVILIVNCANNKIKYKEKLKQHIASTIFAFYKRSK